LKLHDAQQLRVIMIVVTITAIVSVAFTALTVIHAFEPEPWDPLGDYPLQVVLEVNDDHVITEGIKCNASREDVQVRGEFGWQRVDPSGFAFPIGQGTGVRTPGCERFTFQNNIPDEVRNADLPGAQWRIVGTETPFRAEGADGVPHTWQTETFELSVTS
jgi:hypothetical protein